MVCLWWQNIFSVYLFSKICLEMIRITLVVFCSFRRNTSRAFKESSCQNILTDKLISALFGSYFATFCFPHPLPIHKCQNESGDKVRTWHITSRVFLMASTVRASAMTLNIRIRATGTPNITTAAVPLPIQQ